MHELPYDIFSEILFLYNTVKQLAAVTEFHHHVKIQLLLVDVNDADDIWVILLLVNVYKMLQDENLLEIFVHFATHWDLLGCPLDTRSLVYNFVNCPERSLPDRRAQHNVILGNGIFLDLYQIFLAYLTSRTQVLPHLVASSVIGIATRVLPFTSIAHLHYL